MARVSSINTNCSFSPALEASGATFGHKKIAQLEHTSDEEQCDMKRSYTAQLGNSNLTGTAIEHSVTMFSHEEALPTYEVDVVGREDVLNPLSPTLYKVRIVGPNGTHFVFHRYQNFCILDRHIRPRCQGIPHMPVKGQWCKLGDGFLDRRQERLDKLLRAMIAADPQVRNSVLRRFLGIDSSFAENKVTSDKEEEGEEIIMVIESVPDNQASASSWSSIEDEIVSGPSFAATVFGVRSPSSLCGSPRLGRPWGRISQCGHTSFGGSPQRSQAHDSCSKRRCSSLEICHPRVGQRSSFDAECAKTSISSPRADDPKFREAAIVIARDVARVFAGDARVDRIRLEIADVLRSYARKDPEIGYVQGMCFAAAIICLDDNSLGAEAEARQRFTMLMNSLRELWLPGFPMLSKGTSTLDAVLVARDPELHTHFGDLSLELGMIIPGAWMSVFAKWLPLRMLMDVVPFLIMEGVVGFLAVTLIVLLHNREALLKCSELDEALPYVNNLLSQSPPPEDLVGMCRMALPSMKVAAQQPILSI